MKIETNQAVIDYYRQNGFVILRDVMSDETLEDLQQASDEALADTTGKWVSSDKRPTHSAMFDHKVNVWRHYPRFKAFALNQSIASLASDLMGTRARLFQDQILVKPAAHGSATNWHQDLNVWPFDDQRAFTIWVPLQDVDQHNGCLQYVAGSQQQGKIMQYDLSNPDKPLKDSARPTIAKLKRGDIVCHNSLTLHYAFANHSAQPRFAYAMIFIPENTTSTGKHYFVPTGINKGEKFSGENFPIL